MKHILEIYYQGDCIEQRTSNVPFPNIEPGEQVYIEFQNPGYQEEYGLWWKVQKRRHLLFGAEAGIRTLVLHCVPDPNRGDPYG